MKSLDIHNLCRMETGGCELLYFPLGQEISLSLPFVSLTLGMVCTGFPGPGDSAAIIANPMQEFIEPEGRTIIHSAFDNFLKKHPKDYTGKKEHSHRVEVFRQNLRYVNLKRYSESFRM